MLVEHFLPDLRFAYRILVKRPWFTLAAILTLAVGIGANTAVFSVVEAVLLSPLPFHEPERLVQVQRTIDGLPVANVAAVQYFSWRDGEPPLESITAYTFLSIGINFSDGDKPEHISSRQVTADFFKTFGGVPMIGRDFEAAEDVPGGPDVVMLSHGFWQRRFGGDREILGRRLRLDGRPHTVIGVMPPSFRFPVGTEVWTLLQLDPSTSDRQALLTATARLAPGVSIEAVQASLQVTNQEYVRTHYSAADAVHYGLRVRPLAEHLYSSLDSIFRLLASSALIVLLVACANVINLQLMHLSARKQEIAIRLAVGSTPRRLIRQMMSESVFLALLGALVGLGFCRLSIGPLLSVLPAEIERFHPVEIDGKVLLFTLTVLFLISIIISIIPALRALQIPINSNLKEGGRAAAGPGTGYGGSRWRLALVGAEIALTLSALIIALQLGQSFLRLIDADPGFVQEGRYVAQLPLSGAYGSGAAWQRLSEELVSGLEELPEVRAAGLTTGLPLEAIPDFDFLIAGRDPMTDGVGSGRYRAVTPGYFETFGIPLLRGAAMQPEHRQDTAWVAVVNQALVDRYWEGEDPIGERITIGLPTQPTRADPEPRTIIGVVGNVRENGLMEPAAPAVYVPLPQIPDPMAERISALLPMALVVDVGQISSSEGGLSKRLGERIARFDPDLPMVDLVTAEQLVSNTIDSRRSILRLVGLFAGLALLLSMIGIYGVMASLVLQRARELTLRRVLGARRRQIAALIIRQGGSAVLVGLVAGVGIGWSLSRLIGSALSDLEPARMSSFVIAVTALTCCALLALLIPAYRASRVRISDVARFE